MPIIMQCVGQFCSASRDNYPESYRIRIRTYGGVGGKAREGLPIPIEGGLKGRMREKKDFKKRPSSALRAPSPVTTPLRGVTVEGIKPPIYNLSLTPKR